MSFEHIISENIAQNTLKISSENDILVGLVKDTNEIKWSKDTNYKQKREDTKLYNEKLRYLELDDVGSRILTRKHLKLYFLILLALQHVIVFSLVFLAYFQDKIKVLSLILSILISGTMVESVFILKIITEKTFSEINYNYQKEKKK